jgi:prepilin-type N-terminal cleavage/methylation domain-containing protein
MQAPSRRNPGFTLVELLVVIAIIALLVSILLPSLSLARRAARVVAVHAELRGITLAVEMYRQDNEEAIPPTRFSCSSRTAYDLPVELRGYLPGGRERGVATVAMPDPFRPSLSYRYRAVGPAILNETTVIEDASCLWVPDRFPLRKDGPGRYWSDPDASPVRYAVWSIGPEPESPKFDIPGRLPVPQRYWLTGPSDSGVIVHLEDAQRRIHMSP